MTPLRLYLCILTACTLALAPFPTGLLRIDAPLNPRISTTGYERKEAFGGWAPVPGTSCDTRAVALAAVWGEHCAVPHREWLARPITDPYTGEPLTPAEVELDHLYPLSAAWDMGAHTWPQDKRVAFANDPLNLVVTSSRANQAKADHLPGEWMPPWWRSRCAYSRQLAAVASKYELPLSRDDAHVMHRACAGLQGLASARSL